jgi:hypothetical protein
MSVYAVEIGISPTKKPVYKASSGLINGPFVNRLNKLMTLAAHKGRDVQVISVTMKRFYFYVIKHSITARRIKTGSDNSNPDLILHVLVNDSAEDKVGIVVDCLGDHFRSLINLVQAQVGAPGYTQ